MAAPTSTTGTIVATALHHHQGLNCGTLAEAQELLGHAYTATTMAYAKVDLVSLRKLVVPFGQVPR